MTKIMPLMGITDPQLWPNSCNANLYETGDDPVEWHADNEEMFQSVQQATRIISMSFGGSREFQVRHRYGRWKHTTVTPQILMSGDLCLMDGFFQKHYEHKVPN